MYIDTTISIILFDSFLRIDTEAADTYRYEVSILSDVSPITKDRVHAILKLHIF